MIKEPSEEALNALAKMATVVGGEDICGHPCDQFLSIGFCKCYDDTNWDDDDDDEWDYEAGMEFDPDDLFFDDDYEPECCPFCGKEYEDFSDLGCGHCDRRHPDWGTY
jgi:hypothetical protein